MLAVNAESEPGKLGEHAPEIFGQARPRVTDASEVRTNFDVWRLTVDNALERTGLPAECRFDAVDGRVVVLTAFAGLDRADRANGEPDLDGELCLRLPSERARSAHVLAEFAFGHEVDLTDRRRAGRAGAAVLPLHADCIGNGRQ
jgi:hypothetical protein